MKIQMACWKGVLLLLVSIFGDSLATEKGTTTLTKSTVPTTLSTGVAPRSSPLECYLCLEGEPKSVCGLVPTLTACQNMDEVCFWNVSMESGALFSHKGCMPRQECLAAENSNDADCARDVVTGFCMYCCDGQDRCNVDRDINNPPDTPGTTDRPTTSPNVPSSPPWTTDTSSTIAPSSAPCNFYGWEECVFEFGLGVSSAIMDPEIFFSQFCRSVPAVLECLAASSQHCCDTSDAMNATFQRILAEITSVCPVTCSEEAGLECTSTLYSLVYKSIMEDTNCEQIDRLLVEKKRCVETTVGSCDGDVKSVIVSTYTRIERETEKICSQDPPSSPPETEPETCEVEHALGCIERLGDLIMAGIQHPTDADYKYLCKLADTTEECIREVTGDCSDSTKWRLWHLFEFTKGLIGEECEALEKLVCETATARACLFSLWNAVEEERDMTKACGLVNSTMECVTYFMRGCTDREISSMQDMVDMVMALLDCDTVIEINSPGSQINISECGDNEEAKILYRFTKRPSSICPHPNCRVFIEWEIELRNSPRCRNQQAIQQAVINGVSSTCADEITDDNYGQWQEVSVASKLDRKVDGTQSRRLTMWMKKIINGIVEERKSIGEGWMVNIDDCDRQSTCSSINDPHMRTFDKLYYDNFYDGHYVMYRHTELPFEVEAIFQKCSHHASCNCGAAIRSGDNVILFDRCRKKDYHKKCEKYCYGHKHNQKKCDKYDCPNFISVTLYGYDRKLTDGTRIFRRCDGKTYEVVLPHGTVVKVAVNGQYINIWITPSPADYKKTVGLCGTYNGNKHDDLTYPDGNLYPPGFERGCQPRDFSKSWEAKKYDRIYKGVARTWYDTPRYCECNLNQDGDSQQRCGFNARLELCDFDTSGEITSELVYKMVKPKIKHRHRRQTEEEEEEEEYDFDMSKTEDVDDIMARSIYNETYATQLCEDYFNSAASAKLCQEKVKINTTDDVDSCVKDLRVTNDSSWMVSSLEAIKEACSDELSLQPRYSEDNDLRTLVDQITASLCPNECSNTDEEIRGACVNGTCECQEPWVGEDCSMDSSAAPDFVAQFEGGLCDETERDCGVARILGLNILDNVYCHLTQVEVTDTGVVIIGNEESIQGEFQSINEVHCPLPSSSSYLIEISNSEDGTRSNQTLHLAHDSVCHECIVDEDDPLGALCTRTADSCIIESGCYAAGQTADQDDCKICDPRVSDSQWQTSDVDGCGGLSTGVIVAIAAVSCVALGALVAGVVIVRTTRKKQKSFGVDKGYDNRKPQAEFENQCYEDSVGEDMIGN